MGLHSIFNKKNISSIPISYSLRNIFSIAFIIYSVKLIKLNNMNVFYVFLYIYKYTCATGRVCVSRFTSPVTLTSRFVTWRVVQTVTTTVVVTIITIGPFITLCNILYLYEVKNTRTKGERKKKTLSVLPYIHSTFFAYKIFAIHL